METGIDASHILRFATDSADFLISYVDRDLVYRYANRAYEAWFGFPSADICGRTMGDILGDEAVESLKPYIGRALQGERITYETDIVYKHSGPRHVRASYVPDIRDDGRVVGFAVLVSDVTEQRRDQEAQKFLVAASDALAASLDYEVTLSKVAELAVDSIADWCVVSMREGATKSRRIALAHRDPERVQWALELETKYPADPNALTGEPQVLRTGEPELYSTIPKDLLKRAAKDDEHLRLIEEAQLESAMVVPILAGEEVLGAITFVSGTPGRFGESELKFAEDLAARSSLAIQNARLYQSAQTEIEERKSLNRRFRTLIEQSPLSIQTFDPSGLCTHANPAWEKLWGVSRDHLSDYNILNDEQLVRKGIMDDVQAAFLGETRKLPPIRYDPAETGKPGRPRWVEIIVYPVFTETGELEEVVLILQDLSAERAVQEELQTTQERFRLMVDSALDAVISINSEHEVLDWEGRAQEIFGYSREDAEGKKLYDLILPEEYVQPHRDGMRHYLETGDGPILNSTVEIEAVRKSGERFPVELAIAVVRDRDTPTFTAFIRDITDRKVAESALRESQAQYQALAAELEQRVHQRTQQLEQANRELEAFSYSVSHDLRAPLRTISSFAQLLSIEQEERLDDEGKDNLKRILDAGKRMSKLIDDLLQYARLSRVELKLDVVDLSALAESVVQDLRQKFPERSVDVRVDPEMTVHGDISLLRVALENLLENAWKFTSKSAQQAIHVGHYREADAQIYFVRDSGAGFDMKYSNKLFKPFERLHGDVDYPGTGIGLVNVQRIIQRHGGRMWAEAALGKGATFFFTFARAK
jgi:PAS domain S-box-containing protein